MTGTQKLAAAALGGTGLIHLILAPEYFGEQAYIGVLFVLAAATCGYVAARLWSGRETLRDWALGIATAAGMFVGFILSRTVGLPGFHEADWELSGLVTLVLDAGFVGLALSQLPQWSRSAQIATSGSASGSR
jgi:hypothetical protein